MEKSNHFVITINREAGTGGRSIGAKVAERLGVRFFDKAVTEQLTQYFNLSKEEIEKHKAEKSWWTKLLHSFLSTEEMSAPVNVVPPSPTPENLYSVEESTLLELAKEQSCVIAGRSSAFVFRNHPNAIKIFITSSLEKRVQRIMEKQSKTREEAMKLIEELDEGRESFVKKVTSQSRYDARLYDLCVNVANLTEDQVVDFIMRYIESSGLK